MKTEADEITRLKLQLAQTETLLQQEKLKREALETMVAIAEKDGVARAVPKGSGTESASSLSAYTDTLRAVASAFRFACYKNTKQIITWFTLILRVNRFQWGCLTAVG